MSLSYGSNFERFSAMRARKDMEFQQRLELASMVVQVC
jgi:hypothetical protein